MTKNAQRLSQLISTFGPGTMIDLPTRSVVVGGLEFWDMRANSFTPIPEPRLTVRLEQLLKEQGRLDPDISLSLRTPPVLGDSANGIPHGIAAPVFPAWFVCEQIEAAATTAGTLRKRRLVRWQDLDTKGRRRFVFDDGRKSEVTPIRFVCACEKGHLQDIDWRWVVHGAAQCQEPLWVEEKGTSADPADTNIVCGCGRRLSLQDAFQPGRLGKCRGDRPWLLDRDPDGCGDNLKLLTRTATNTYFPQVYTVISLPSEEDDLTRLVDELSGDLANVQTIQDVAQAKRFNPKVSVALGGYPDVEIFERLSRLREEAKVDAYTLLHSLSHALMTEIALDSGYPASSLKERIYALTDSRNGRAPVRCGILIYTATPGAQGTLGGLVAVGSRFSCILRSALDRLRICSNDPVCADHDPDGRSGDRATHGAACHGCLLIAETRCEMRNLFLDSLLVQTMAGHQSNFFD